MAIDLFCGSHLAITMKKKKKRGGESGAREKSSNCRIACFSLGVEHNEAGGHHFIILTSSTNKCSKPSNDRRVALRNFASRDEELRQF